MTDERLDDLLEITGAYFKLLNLAKKLGSRKDVDELVHLYKALNELDYIRDSYYEKLGI